MKIDLHIHTRSGSDGAFTIDEVFEEAKRRNIGLISITDHDSIDCQESAIILAKEHGMTYITGMELNVTFLYNNKSISLDFLGYQYDIGNRELKSKLRFLKEHRENRARQILEKINIEFEREHIKKLTDVDIRIIQESVDGTFGRPHIADYLVKKGVVSSRQEAFDKYLVKCDVPKYPLPLAEAAGLIRNAGGKLVIAHPGDPHGTSLVSITPDLGEQTNIIKEYMLKYLDGVECWHSRHDAKTVEHYIDFARKNRLLMTGGSDCHQKPVIMGTMDIPGFVAEQFN